MFHFSGHDFCFCHLLSQDNYYWLVSDRGHVMQFYLRTRYMRYIHLSQSYLQRWTFYSNTFSTLVPVVVIITIIGAKWKKETNRLDFYLFPFHFWLKLAVKTKFCVFLSICGFHLNSCTKFVAQLPVVWLQWWSSRGAGGEVFKSPFCFFQAFQHTSCINFVGRRTTTTTNRKN